MGWDYVKSKTKTQNIIFNFKFAFGKLLFRWLVEINNKERGYYAHVFLLGNNRISQGYSS